MIVLNKVKISNEIMEGRLIPRLQEKAPGVAEDLRLQQEGIVDFGRDFLHQILLSRVTGVDSRGLERKRAKFTTQEVRGLITSKNSNFRKSVSAVYILDTPCRLRIVAR